MNKQHDVRGRGVFAFLSGAFLVTSPLIAGVSISWTSVDAPGNAADATTGSGTVNYTYSIGRFEVTNAQYVQFLNAKAVSSDPLQLYNSGMGSNAAAGGIISTYTSGTYSYSLKPGTANKPVAHISWFNAIRFANWMNNGQGNASTETGSYTLLGGTALPTNWSTVTRNPGAGIVLPTSDEWYKAAYYQPAGGDADHYWTYPTRSNVVPKSDQPPGDPAIQGNVANFQGDDGIANGYDDGFAVTGTNNFVNTQNYLTDVGAYLTSPSFFGTFDQGGNVREWNETRFHNTNGNTREIRGGSWSNSDGVVLGVTFFNYLDPNYRGDDTVGFRLALVGSPGDADRNQRVNADDYFLIDRGYSQGLNLWDNGDFNGDALINGDDYAIIDAAYASAAHALPADSITAVPEPTSCAAIAALTIAAFSRLRRGKERRD